MAENAELAFVKNHLNTIGALPIQFPDDFQQPAESTLKKIPILPVDLPEPPERKNVAEATPSENISVTFKSTKPARSFTLPLVSPADTIKAIKEQLATQPGAPPADAQRLLLRGKALADGKLLQEYSVKSGDVVNVMLKPGFEWDWNTDVPVTKAAPGIVTPRDHDGDVQMILQPAPSTDRLGRSPSKHGRIPSVILSPSPSSTPLPLAEHAPSPIPLTIDVSDITSVTEGGVIQNAFQKKMTSPDFWERLYAFLGQEFETEESSAHAFEVFLVGSKGALTPSEIAKIRDTVGIVGMGGT